MGPPCSRKYFCFIREARSQSEFTPKSNYATAKKVKKVRGSFCTSRFLNCEWSRGRIVADGVSMLIARRSENFLATGKWSHQSVIVPKTWPAKASGGLRSGFPGREKRFFWLSRFIWTNSHTWTDSLNRLFWIGSFGSTLWVSLLLLQVDSWVSRLI